MTGLNIFALIVLSILLLTGVAIWVALAALPGQISKKRNHPQAEAVNVGGWLGRFWEEIPGQLFLSGHSLHLSQVVVRIM